MLITVEIAYQFSPIIICIFIPITYCEVPKGLLVFKEILIFLFTLEKTGIL